MHASSEAGFSLIETLVALSVLAVSSLVLLSASEGHTRAVTSVSDRTVARWVAQNSLVELEHGRADPERVEMAGIEWNVSIRRSETGDPEIARLDIRVARATELESVLARLTGFIDASSGPVE